MKTPNALEVVLDLNLLLFQIIEEPLYEFKYSSNGYYSEYISFNDYVLWSFEDDEREFNEELNEYEPLLPFVKKKFNGYLEELNKMKLI